MTWKLFDTVSSLLHVVFAKEAVFYLSMKPTTASMKSFRSPIYEQMLFSKRKIATRHAFFLLQRILPGMKRFTDPPTVFFILDTSSLTGAPQKRQTSG